MLREKALSFRPPQPGLRSVSSQTWLIGTLCLPGLNPS